jgi:AraC-like DNA-binding protein
MTVLSHDGVVVIDPDWACRVINACQAGLGYAVEGDPTCLEELCGLLEQRIGAPRNVAEMVFAGQSMIPLLDRLGDLLHRRFHDRFGGTSCRTAFAGLSSNPLPNPMSGITFLLKDWRARYSSWFHAHHPLPSSLRAKQVLHECYAEPITMQVLARMVGSNRTSLIEQFTAAFGVSPAEYLVRVRIREGLRHLRNAGVSTEEAARSSGYQSTVKFTARARRATGLTPRQLRQLGEREFDALLEDRVSLLSHATGPLERRSPQTGSEGVGFRLYS